MNQKQKKATAIQENVLLLRASFEQMRVYYSRVVDLYDDFDMMAYPFPVQLMVDDDALDELMKLSGKVVLTTPVDDSDTPVVE